MCYQTNMFHYRPLSHICAIPVRLSTLRHAYRVIRICPIRNMSRVLVRKADSEERMHISLKYAFGKEPNRVRQFNFDRLVTEEVVKTLGRIQENISKVLINKTKRKKKKAKAAESSDVPAVEDNDNLIQVTLLDGNRQQIDGKILNDVAWTSSNTLCIENVDYKIVINPPSVIKITLPTRILVGFPIEPKMNAEFIDLDLSEFIWYHEGKSGSDDDWTVIHKGYSYMPCSDDTGLRLKVRCIPHNDHEVGEPAEAISKNTVIEGPGCCPFEKRHQYTQYYASDDCIRIMTYNILADTYADSDYSRDYLFPYCPPEVLDINYRRHLLIKEITGYKSDIICLQEVDQKVFTGYLMPVLNRQGYEGHLKMKTGSTAEGTATFFRTNKFRLVNQHDAGLVDVLTTEPVFENLLQQVNANESLSKLLLERTTTLQVTALEHIQDPSKHILVATTHLYFHPRASNIRVLQTYLCVKYLELVLQEYEVKGEKKPTVIFCGDLNSYPEGGVHTLLCNRHIPANHADWYSGGKEQFVDGLELSHSLQLGSACGYPRYTNYVSGFAACLDYIYIEDTKLKTVSVVPMPTHEEVTKYTALPNVVFPSDHIALICDLKWIE